MEKELAKVLLADAVASEIEGQEEYLTIREKVIRPQEDILNCLESTCEDLGIEIENYLPLSEISEIIEAYNQAWSGKVTFEEFYNEFSAEAHRSIMGAIGHGVSILDDDYVVDWLKQKGVVDILPKKRFESPYSQGYDLAQEILRKHLSN